MTRNEFIKACEKAGCILRDGKVMVGDLELGSYYDDRFDVMADLVNLDLRHCWLYSQVDLNTFKVLLKDLIEGYMNSIQGTKDAKKA